MSKPSIEAVEFSGFTAHALEQARQVVEGLLDIYDGKLIEGLSVRATHVSHNSVDVIGLQAANFSILGDWRLRFYRSGGSYDWTIEQGCPACGGGSRRETAWDKARNEEQTVLACGGCGLALAEPGMGVSTFVRIAPTFDFPRPELEQMIGALSGVNPFSAVLEAEAFVTFCRLFAIAGADLPHWSKPENLAALLTGAVVAKT